MWSICITTREWTIPVRRLDFPSFGNNVSLTGTSSHTPTLFSKSCCHIWHIWGLACSLTLTHSFNISSCGRKRWMSFRSHSWYNKPLTQCLAHSPVFSKINSERVGWKTVFLKNLAFLSHNASCALCHILRLARSLVMCSSFGYFLGQLLCRRNNFFLLLIDSASFPTSNSQGG